MAHPEEAQEYVDQCGFVVTWFREMFERVGGDDERAAGEAREALIELVFGGVRQLTALALGGGSSAEWARRLLAGIEVRIDKHRKEFGKGYEDFRRELSVVFRNDLWQPESPLYQALHRELCLCWLYRREIPWPQAQRYFSELKLPMSDEYRPCLGLPPLRPSSLKEWDELLWSLVKKHNPGLLGELQKRYKRVEVCWSKYRKEFRQHLKRIAEAF